MVRYSIVALLLCSANVAHAGDRPLYQPVPAWVQLAPEPGSASPAASEASNLLILDSQQRLEADGTVWSYVERATRILSAQALAQTGTVSIDWQPAHGDLIVHAVDILRGGQRIDALKAGPQFTVLRREAQLERLTLDGRLTATLAVQGLQVGDVLDVRYTVTRKDPSLKGRSVAVGPVMAEPAKFGFARTRLLWPQASAVRWKAYPGGAVPSEQDAGGWRELVFKLPVARQPDMPVMAPGRFRRPPIVEASSFADWAAVSRVMEPLYRTEGLIASGSPLAAEVARIARSESDPLRRTALALAFVQEKTRYLAMAMDNGNYVPQTPAETWQTRYGDCKAKTLLLLAVLHGLGIEAEPALASLGNGDLVAARLPSPMAFNHIFVIARVAGKPLWLDGTGVGAHLLDIGDVLPFGWVLPVRPEGAALVEVPRRAPERPTMRTTLDIDMTGGFDLPAPFDATVTLRGGAAGQLKTMMAQMDRETLQRSLQNYLPRREGEMIVTSHKVTFDDAAGTATIALSGTGNPRWNYADARYRYDLSAINVPTLPDRSRAIWKDVPVVFGTPGRTAITARYKLPDAGKDFALEGNPALDVALPGGRQVTRKVTLAGGIVTLELLTAESGAEIAAADLAAARGQFADVKNRTVRLVTVAGYSGPWNGVVAAKRAGKFARPLADYAAHIAEKPEEAGRYLARAYFLMKIFEREKALADFDKAIALQADSRTYAQRARLLEHIGRNALALEDLEAAQALEPGDNDILWRLAVLRARLGQSDAALAAVEARIDAGADGEDGPRLLATKASVLAESGNAEAAIAAIDGAVAKRPGDGGFLNSRCWIKATLKVQLESALKDCTRAIELGGNGAAAALDSRAMVYFRMGRLDEALADLAAALELRPAAPASLFMRGVVAGRAGKDARAAAADLAAARLLLPRVDEDYARYGIKP